MNNLEQTLSTPALRANIIQAMLLLSGASALAYELIWIRMLGVYFGHTIYAVSSVITALMLGLVLGAFFLGRLADRVSNPLRLYAFLELALGALCIIMPWLFDAIYVVYVPLHAYLGDALVLRTSLQFIFCLVLLIAPSLLMGGTLPVAAKALAPTRDAVGQGLSRLYGANTLGAALGIFIVGYWLLQTIGLKATNLTAATLNIIIGMMALILSFRWPLKNEHLKEIQTEVASSLLVQSERWILASAFFSGAMGMCYEIACMRSVTLVFGSSIYTVTSILLSFLFFIGLGSRLFAYFAGSANMSVLGGLYVAISLAAFSLVLVYEKLPWLYSQIVYTSPELAQKAILLQALIIAALMGPTGMLLGGLFSCAASLVAGGVNQLGSKFGSICSSNMAGSIFGTIVAGFVLIPMIGVRSTLMLVCFMGLILGTGFLLTSPRMRSYLLGIVLGLYIMGVLMPSDWDPLLFLNTYIYRLGKSAYSTNWSMAKERAHERDLLFYEEGINANVAVTQNRDGFKSLWVNGKIDASDAVSDVITQRALGYTPLLLHPAPKRTLIIGLGSGMTANTVAEFSEPETIDIVEMSTAVVKASKYFFIEIPKDNRRSLFIDDGRNYLKSHENQYDVIISEPSNPWMSGINDLFTKEFFELAKMRLAQGGIICQWLQGYDLHDNEMKLVLRTFLSVFPNMTLWSAGSNDFLLLGPKDEFALWNQDKLNERLADGGQLPRGISDINSFAEWAGESYHLESKEVEQLVGEGKLNTDDKPYLEFTAPLSLFKKRDNKFLKLVREHRNRLLPPFLQHTKEKSVDFRLKRAFELFGAGRFVQARIELEMIPSMLPELFTKKFLPIPVEEGPFNENFDGTVTTSVYPFIGSHAPPLTAVEERREWEFFNLAFSRLSGVEKGSGKNGSSSLAVKAPNGLTQGALFIPLNTQSDREYAVSFSAKNSGGISGMSGVGIVEFDTPTLLEESYSKEFIDNHELSRKRIFANTLKDEWEQAEVVFKTSAKTKAVHLVFYVLGDSGGKLLIDKLSITGLSGKK